MGPGVIRYGDQFTGYIPGWVALAEVGAGFDDGNAAQQVRPVFGGEFGIAAEIQVRNFFGIVRIFQAIEKRASLQGKSPGVGGDFLMGLHTADGHGQMQVNNIALLPGAMETSEAIGHL